MSSSEKLNPPSEIEIVNEPSVISLSNPLISNEVPPLGEVNKDLATSFAFPLLTPSPENPKATFST